ncbi:serine hydrolase domain-containing protein [Aquihabitans sp. McL0605]|uniref:serine hydrolase domain-containing protein n=1 Tax=Aquihabitans sp. McL0605 TaxID=3415671 RepID=UPI003CF33EB4
MDADIDGVLAGAVADGAAPGVVAAAWSDRGAYLGAAGEAVAGAPMATDSVVRIFSMSKAVTASAVMQLVEQGRVTLDEPAGELVPYLAEVQVIDGFDGDGVARLRPPTRPVTLRNLLTHTSGFGYDFADAVLAQHLPTIEPAPGNSQGSYEHPLTADPGTRWSYGIGVDWAGRVVETVSGQDLGAYFQEHVLGPLGMVDTSFQPSAAVHARLAALTLSMPDGLIALPNEALTDGTPYEMASGGGGLYSTVSDYLRFTRMILEGGALDGARVLAEATVDEMGRDHLGELSATGWSSTNPTFTADVELLPGQRAAWGLSFLINTEATAEGRSPGSLAWAGAANSYYWIDRTRRVTGVFATQVLPFHDPKVLAANAAFERAVYAALG